MSKRGHPINTYIEVQISIENILYTVCLCVSICQRAIFTSISVWLFYFFRKNILQSWYTIMPNQCRKSLPHLSQFFFPAKLQPSYFIWTYRGQQVNKLPYSKVQHFFDRLSLPEDWRGLRDAVLTEKSGIPGCIFVHAGGFIGGNDTYDGALEMARRSLKMSQNKT